METACKIEARLLRRRTAPALVCYFIATRLLTPCPPTIHHPTPCSLTIANLQVSTRRQHYFTSSNNHLRNFLNRELRPLPQIIAKEIQGPNPEYAQRAATSKNRDTPSDAQIDIQRTRKHNASASQRAPAKVVTRKQASRILWIGSWDVDKYALEDDKYPSSVKSDADDRHNPMHITA